MNTIRLVAISICTLFVGMGLSASVATEPETMQYTADQLEGEATKGKNYKKLKGNVVFRFQPSGLLLKADEAYKYDEKNVIEARGNVTIVDQKGNSLKAGELTYYPEKKLAIMTKNVVCQSEKSTFYTPELRYDLAQNKGTFAQGGKLVQEGMVLTSRTGTYNTAQQTVIFSKEVALLDPTYTLHCEALYYNMKTEQATFQGFTKITHADGTIHTQTGGSYLQPEKHLIFNQGTFTTKDLTLAADQLELFDGQNCKATGHVSLDAKQYDVRIIGETATYARNPQKVEIFGNPLLTKEIHGDQLYLRAEHFMAVEEPQKEGPPIQKIHAMRNVRLYEASLQGIANGAIYDSTHNTIKLLDTPIVWCGGYQITGEDVRLVIQKEEAETVKMFVDKNLFMTSADPVGNYNQVKGDKMVAKFKEGVLEKMCIEGNGESLYFVLDEQKELVGMNHIKCTSMEMDMVNNQLEQMKFQPKPLGMFYPAEKLTLEQMKLEHFVWHGEKWPTKENMVHHACPIQEQKICSESEHVP
ncbi:MAG TPA: OstA-like protein [Amoebophilaceae bacterium]|jgi:lipopolysaccharide export system protein LptA|nr:OstA-like protein [Amoebophilaceae bacterium]